ncbi:hypothetical protein M569_13541, partial [Genlisea aurea]
RLVWTAREEEALIAAFYTIIPTWKCENGFQTGFLLQLEKEMQISCPRTQIKGRPHILSNYKIWKREHGLVESLIEKFDVGFNSVTKMVTATDDLWNEIEKEFPERKKLKMKRWPYFESWRVIFGKDRASGEDAQSYYEAQQHIE